MANDEKKRSWASKFGRSMVNSAKITYANMMPNTAETINSAREATREIRTMATKYTSVARQQKGQVKNTPLAKSAKATFDRAMQDLREGTFSRKTTEDLFDSYENDIESSFDIDFNLDDEVADKSPEEIILGGTEGVAKSVVASSAAQIESMDALSRKLIGSNIKTSQANAESIGSTVLYGANLINTTLLATNSKLDAINDNLVSLVDFHGSTMTDAIEQFGNYMEETVSMMNEMGKMFSSMQDLEYGKSQRDERSFKIYGGIDFKEYGRYIKEGFKNSFLGANLSMFNSLGGGKDDLKKFQQDPVGTVMQTLMGWLTPKSTKDAMQNLDKNLPKYFDRILKRIGKYYPKNSELRRIWPWLGIGNIFGNPGTDKNSINMGGYHKDALPWNGYAQRAITEVIPEYLSSMDNSLNTIAEIIQSNEWFNRQLIQKTDDKKRYYDYDEGKFKTRERLVRDFRDDHQYSLGSFGDNINQLLKNITEEDMQEMVREGLDKYLSEAILGSSGDYSKSMKGISGLFKDAKKTDRTTYSRAMLEFEDYIESARKSINDSYQKYGTSSTHVYRNILNDTDRSKDEYKKFMDSVLYDKNYLRTTTGLWLNTESTDQFFEDVLKHFAIEDPDMIHWLAGDGTFITELNNQKFKAMRMEAATKEEILDSCRPIVSSAVVRYREETGDDLFGVILGKVSPKLKNKRDARIKQGKKGGPVTRGINWVDNTLHDLSADFEDGEKKEGFFKKRSTRKTQSDMIREQMQDEELNGSTESILNLDSNELNRTELLQAEAAKKLARIVPQNQEEADNLRDNVLIVALSGITTSFKTFTGGLFGKDGIFNKFWDSDFSKNLREKIKNFFFDEEKGVFGDKVKGGKEKLRNFWEKTKDELMNGYDFVYRNTMTYLYGEDYKDNENYQKYLAWADFKTKRDKRLGRLDDTSESSETPTEPTEERKSSGIASSNIDTEPVEKKTSSPHVQKAASDLLALPAPKEEPKKTSMHELTIYNPETAVDDAKEEYALTIRKGSYQLAEAMDKAADQIGDPDAIEKEAKKTPKSFWEKAKKLAPKVAAAAIAGGLLGTAVQFGSPGILGAAFLPGGPIAGAIAASGLMILSQTEAMRSIMFGKKDEATGERFGGLFNQKMKDSFKKALPFVVGGATLGVIKAAILPNLATGTTFGAVTSAILPTGILGGALLGAGLGILKNSETIKTMLFGEKNDKGERTGAFLSGSYEKFKQGITRFFPTIGRGLKGLGVGALTGLTLSQMGFIPAMFSLGGPVGMGVAGLGLGLLSTSKKFNEFVFGADILDENGEPTGKKTSGLLTRVTNMLKVNVVDKFAQSFEDNAIKLVDWTKDKITLPFRKAFGPILDSILGIKNNIEDFLKEKFDMITSGIMETFDKTMKAIFRPFTTLLGKVINFGMGAITTSAKITMAPTAGLLKLLEIGTMGKRRKEYINYYKDYYKSLPGFLKGKWDTEAEAGERRGIFGKGFDILNSVFNRDSDIALAARAGYNETMAAVGQDHLGWREAPQDQRQLKKDMKAHKKERDMWKKADKLRGNIIRDDLGYREMELTDSQVEKYRRRFAKLGLDESKLQTSDDIMNLLYRKQDWKRGKSISEVILEDGVKVQESPEQKAYRERTEKYQDKMERYLESIKDAMADKGLRHALNLDEMQSETERNRYVSKVVRRMQKKGIDISKYDFRDMGTIDLDLFDDELFDAYRDSEYMESGDFATFAKLKQKERDEARKKKEYQEAKKRKEKLDDRQKMNSSDFMQRVFKDGKLNPDVEFADLETNGMGLAKTSMLNKILQNGAKQGESLDQTLSTKIGSDYEQKLRDSIMKFASTANGELNDTMKELVELIRKGNDIAIEGNEISQTIADTGSAEFEITTEGEMSAEDIDKKRGTRKRGKVLGKFGKRKIEKYHISEDEDKAGILSGVKSFFRTQEDEEKDEKIRFGASSASTSSTALMIRDEDKEEDTEDTEKSLFSMVLGKIASTTSKLMGTPVARFGVSLLKKWALASGVLTVAELISPGFQDKILRQSSELEQALENHDLYYDYVQPALNAFFGKIGDLIRNFSDNFDHYWDNYIYPAATHIIEGVANKVPYIVDILSLILTNLAGPFTEAFIKVLPTIVKDVFRGIWNGTIGDIKPEWYWNSDGSFGYSKEGEWKSGGKTPEEQAKTKEELAARKARNSEYNYKTRINPVTGELEYKDEEGNDIAAIDPTTGAVTKVGDLDKQHIVATAIRNGIFSAANGGNLGSFIFKNTGRAVGATVGGAATLGSAVMPIIPTVAVTGSATRIGGKAGQAIADAASLGKVFRDVAGEYVDKEEAIASDLLRERILGNLTDEEIVQIMKDGKLSFDETGNVTKVRRNATLNELIKKNKWNKELNPEGIKDVNRYVSQDVQTRIMNELFSNSSNATLFGPPTLGMSEEVAKKAKYAKIGSNAINELMGDEGFSNLTERLRDYKLGNITDAAEIDEINSELNGMIKTKLALKAAQEGEEFAEKELADLAKVTTNALIGNVDKADSVGAIIARKTAGASKSALDAAAESSAKAIAKANNGILTGFINKLKSLPAKLKSHKKLMKVIDKVSGKNLPSSKIIGAIATAIEKAATKLAKVAAEHPTEVGGRLAKLLLKAGKGVTRALPIIGLLFTVYDIANGAFNAANLFHVSKDDVNAPMRIVSAIVNALLSWGPFILIDITFELIEAFTEVDMKSKFAEWLYDIIAPKAMEDALDEAQEQFEAERIAYNEEHEDANLSATAYNDMKNKGMLATAKDTVTGWFNKITRKTTTKVETSTSVQSSDNHSNTTSIVTSSNEGAGFGEWSKKSSSRPMGYGDAALSQKDSKWSNVPLGTLPNGKASTMADGGCGPTSLAMVASQLTGTNVDPGKIGIYASRNGYISQGGANAGLFSEGATNLGLKSQQLTNVGQIVDSLKAGAPTIISGRGNHNSDPYTSDGHIVVANGLDASGNVIIRDPLDGKTKTYPIGNVINKATGSWSYGYGNPMGYGFLDWLKGSPSNVAAEEAPVTYAATSAATKNKTSSSKSSNASKINGQTISNPRHYSNAWAGTTGLSDATLRILLNNYKNASTTTEEVYTTLKSYANQQMIISPNSWDGISKNGAGYAVYNAALSERCVNNFIYKYRNNSSYVKACRESLDRASATGNFGAETTLTSDNTVDDGTSLLQNLGIQIEGTREGVTSYIRENAPDSLAGKFSMLGTVFSNYVSALVGGEDPWEAIAKALSDEANSEESEDGSTYTSNNTTGTIKNQNLTIPENLRISLVEFGKKYPSLQERIKQIGPFAQQVGVAASLPPSYIVAQGIKESTLGPNGMARRTNNMFGLTANKSQIKAGRYVAGSSGNFLKSDSVGGGMVDYGIFMQGDYYSGIRAAKSADEAADAFAQSPYLGGTQAQKNEYAKELKQFYKQYNLYDLDKVKGWGAPMGYGSMSEAFKKISDSFKGKLYDKVGFSTIYDRAAAVENLANAMNGTGKKSSTQATTVVGASYKGTSNNAKTYMKQALGNARISSDFGMRKHPISGQYKKHNGIDYAAPGGTNIYSPVSGTVVRSSNGYNGGYGNLVVVKDGQGYQHYFAHQSKRSVENGTRVSKGSLVGHVGTTGASTGNHLHYGIMAPGGYYINPANYNIGFGNPKLGTTKVKSLSAMNMNRRIVVDPTDSYYGAIPPAGGSVVVQNNNGGIESRLDNLTNIVSTWYGDAKSATSANTQNINIINSGNTNNINRNNTTKNTNVSRSMNKKEIKNKKLESMHKVLAAL